MGDIINVTVTSPITETIEVAAGTITPQITEVGPDPTIEEAITPLIADIADLTSDILDLETRVDDLPRGIVGIATRTTNSPTFTASSADIAGLSVTFDAVAGRRYKATLVFETLQGTASGIWVVGINEGTTVLRRVTGGNSTSAASVSYSTFYTNSSSISGPKTWKVTGLAASGTGIVMVAGTGSGDHYTAPPATLMIEDIGAL